MCKNVKITEEQLTKAMSADYQKLVQQVTDVVNEAPDGGVISGRPKNLVLLPAISGTTSNGLC